MMRYASAPAAPFLNAPADTASTPAPVLSGGARPSFAPPAEPVIQRAKKGGKSLDRIAEDARNVHTLSARRIRDHLADLETHRGTLHFADPRLARVERLTHILSRQQLARTTNRPHLLTRLLSPHQLARPQVGINSVRTSARSLNRNLGVQLSATGKGTTRLTRLYSFMRSNGRAGFQGFHRDLGDRNRRIHGIINKLGVDPRRLPAGRRGAKFVLAAVDRRQLTPANVLDTNDPGLRTQFLRKYPKNTNLFDTHAREGVVAHDGHVPTTAVKGIRAFRGRRLAPEFSGKKKHPDILSQAEVDEISEGLLDQASAEPEPTFKPDWKNPYRRDDDNSGNGGGGRPQHLLFA